MDLILRPSSSERWIKCPASAQLEQGYPTYFRESGKQGAYAHSIAEWCLKNNADVCAHPDYHSIPTEMRVATQMYVDFVNEFPDNLIEKKVSLKPLGIAWEGTADCIGFIEKDNYFKTTGIRVIDFKYGKVKVHAENNTQILIYAYCFLHELGFIESERLIFINKDWYQVAKLSLEIFQPRISKRAPRNLPVNTDWCGYSQWVLTVDELLAHIETVKKAIELTKSDSPTYSPGKHCLFCKAKNDCPAKWRGAEYGYSPPAPKSDIHFDAVDDIN